MAFTNIANLFSLLGGATDFNSDRITNVHGDAMPEFVTMDETWGLVQPGAHVPLFIEQTIWFENVLGHGASQMTDSAAVYDLFLRLDPTLASKSPEEALTLLKPIFEAASNQPLVSLEWLVDALGNLLDANFNSNATIDDRQVHFEDISAVRDAIGTDGYSVVSLVGEDAGTLAASAHTDIAYRYALWELNPFALLGANYSSRNTNRELDLYTDGGKLTINWIQDRGAMLDYKMRYDTGDIDYSDELNDDTLEGDWDYTDLGVRGAGNDPFKIAIDGNGIEIVNHQIVFGTHENDDI